MARHHSTDKFAFDFTARNEIENIYSDSGQIQLRDWFPARGGAGHAETPECVSLRPETTDLIEIEGEHPQGNWHGMPQCGLGYHNVAQNGPT